MNTCLKKWLSLFFAVILCCSALVGCGSDVESDDKQETPKQTEAETTVPTEPENTMDWSVFASIGVDSTEAETIFTKLGFTYLTDLQPIGTSTINYQLFPYGVEETPIDIMVEDGKITQVTLRHLHVADGVRDAYFDDEKLPETWYYKGEKGYKTGVANEIGVIMFDTYMYENAYYVGVNWEARELYYFE